MKSLARRHIDIPQLLSRKSTKLYAPDQVFDSADAYEQNEQTAMTGDLDREVDVQEKNSIDATVVSCDKETLLLEQLKYNGCHAGAEQLADSLSNCGTFRRIVNTLRLQE